MSLVTKCDFCGAIYGFDSETLNATIRVASSKHYFNPETDSNYDLCPDCTNAMLEFIDVMKSGDRYIIQTEEKNWRKPNNQ